MDIRANIIANPDYDVVFQITSGLSAEIETEGAAQLGIVGEVYGIGNGKGYGYGSGSMPSLVAFGMEDNPGFGRAINTLPSLTQETTSGGFYVPQKPIIAFAQLPLLSNVAIGVRSRAGSAIGQNMLAMSSLGGDFRYGVGQATLPALKGFGMYGEGPFDVTMIDTLLCGTSMSTENVMSVLFISDGVLTDFQTLTRIQAVEFVQELVASDFMTVLGTFTTEMLSTLHAESIRSETVVGIGGIEAPDLDESGAVWVVNIDTGASGQYEKYGFNSFIQRDGKYYGVANDGIFELTGDDDAGINIDALVDFGKSNLGTSYHKKVPYVYIGVGSNGTLYLKVDADGAEYIYEMRSSSESLSNHRVDPGKGLEGAYWNFTLMNKDGESFTLDTIRFQPLISSRRI